MANNAMFMRNQITGETALWLLVETSFFLAVQAADRSVLEGRGR